jgi:enoyl-CoA hydratase/carnithine racemase
LYGSKKIYISAINGHCLAGGCLVGMSCDYRIMLNGTHKIGLTGNRVVANYINFNELCFEIND